MKYICQPLTYIAFLSCLMTNLAYAAEGDASSAEPTDAAAEQATSEQTPAEPAEVPAVKPAKPTKAAKPSKATGPGAIVPSGNIAASTTAMLSHRVNNRLQLGTSVGFASIKPSAGTWQGLGFSSLTGAWKGSSKTESSFYISGRYTPYAGVLTVEHEDYDATMHGLFVGPQWQLSIGSQGSVLKAGLELGYLLVYAKPQDRYSNASRAKENKVVAGSSLEFAWTLLEKVQVGPFFAAHAGSTQVFQGGVASSFLF